MVTVGSGSATIINTPVGLFGLSTDTKPLKMSDINSEYPDIDIPNGSSFMEMDTGSVSLFDETNKRWLSI